MRGRHCVTGFLLYLTALWCCGGDGGAVGELTNATLREVIRTVRIKPTGRPDHPAVPDDKVQGEDLLRTGGEGSKVLVEFNNGQQDRLGEGSVFSFSAKTGRLNLSKGLMLFSATEGGRFFCETCAFNASAESTAVVEVFEVTGNAGKPARCAAKFILLEGKATVVSLDGKQKRLMRGGEMILQFADEPVLAQTQEVDVKRLLRESRIVTAFKSPLPSMGKIQAVIDRQQRELWRGTLERTSLTIGGRGPDRYRDPLPVKNDLEAPFDPDVPRGIPLPPCPNCP